jgi:hypothetical protein
VVHLECSGGEGLCVSVSHGEVRRRRLPFDHRGSRTSSADPSMQSWSAVPPGRQGRQAPPGGHRPEAGRRFGRARKGVGGDGESDVQLGGGAIRLRDGSALGFLETGDPDGRPRVWAASGPVTVAS